MIHKNGTSSPLLIILLFSVSPFFMAGCASHLERDIAQVKPGMYKDEVLEVAGSPQRTQRWQGMDRWTYIYFENQSREEKEVHFAEGKALYVGAPVAPLVSAAQQDSIFETQNAELEVRYAKQREEAHKSYPKYEEDVRGTNEIRLVPHFEPVQ